LQAVLAFRGRRAAIVEFIARTGRRNQQRLFAPYFLPSQKKHSMPEIIDLVMIVTFLAVWAMIATDLIGRHGRETKRATPNARLDRRA
jgi:hypothetical protein